MLKNLAKIILIHAILKSVMLSKLSYNDVNDFDFVNAAEKFCAGRPSRNFCSEKHLDLMYQIDKERKRKIREEAQMKKMLKNITKLLFKQL